MRILWDDIVFEYLKRRIAKIPMTRNAVRKERYIHAWRQTAMSRVVGQVPIEMA